MRNISKDQKTGWRVGLKKNLTTCGLFSFVSLLLHRLLRHVPCGFATALTHQLWVAFPELFSNNNEGASQVERIEGSDGLGP